MKFETTLGISERVIPPFTFKARKPWFFSSFATPEKSFEGEVNPELCILENLRKNVIKFWFDCFPFCEFYLTTIKRNRFFVRFPGILSKGKSFVISPPSELQDVIHFGDLELGW